MTHEDYMHQALALAHEAAAHGEVPVGCVIVKDGRIIAEGWHEHIDGAVTGGRRSRPSVPTRRWRPWPRPTPPSAHGGWRTATCM